MNHEERLKKPNWWPWKRGNRKKRNHESKKTKNGRKKDKFLASTPPLQTISKIKTKKPESRAGKKNDI